MFRSFIAATFVTALASSGSALAAASDYQFELAGAVQSKGDGTSVVSLKLVHVDDQKLVSGATISETRADMGPEQMAPMTAEVTVLPENAGVYRFAIKNGAIWKKTDKWALTVAAKVKGEPETVHGNVTITLEP